MEYLPTNSKVWVNLPLELVIKILLDPSLSSINNIKYLLETSKKLNSILSHKFIRFKKNFKDLFKSVNQSNNNFKIENISSINNLGTNLDLDSIFHLFKLFKAMI